MTSRVSREGFIEGCTIVVHLLRDGIPLLSDERSFDQLDCETSLQMPLDVTF
jgi:hypothetical protein